MKRHHLLLILLLAVIALLPAATSSSGADLAPPEPAPKPSDDDRRMRSDLVQLADAWAAGGGRFGYPFWDKAAQRWRAHEISASLFREYVTGYRDRLVVGCEALDDVDVDGDLARDVRELVTDSCDDRIEGLRAQQRWLDELILREAGRAGLDLEESDERLAELDAETQDRFTKSFRATRLAMDQLQAALDEQGMDRLPEDAFI
ncbi:MAG: hypothetical protein JWM25_896 [Thermoleophilia bacterium]|nr:hypothetical protein [Thermoleophilia bacterium]MCZ4496313.1 hypothetical protein [Thermoleophilia bacterium]